jgi:hypothetical protein
MLHEPSSPQAGSERQARFVRGQWEKADAALEFDDRLKACMTRENNINSAANLGSRLYFIQSHWSKVSLSCPGKLKPILW